VDSIADSHVYANALQAEPENVGTLRRELSRAIQPLDISAARAADIVLVVSEALTNVTVHAYIGMPLGPVALTAAVTNGSLRVTVTDEGRGMLPRTDSPGLGLGLGLIARLTDALEISSPGGRGTELCVSFAL
jgi:serine/threonine-protein kinase RsbW/stage II sporulation protein AB (anti-sigma F factor)